MTAIQHLNTVDVRNAVSRLFEKGTALLEACETHEKLHTIQSEIALVVAAGDFEIEATNFATNLRTKLTAGVVQ